MCVYFAAGKWTRVLVLLEAWKGKREERLWSRDGAMACFFSEARVYSKKVLRDGWWCAMKGFGLMRMVDGKGLLVSSQFR